MIRPLAAAAIGLLATAGSPPAAAELRCDAPGNLLRWPEETPVWELCWLHPSDSSGPAGSGLELRHVHFRGIRVLERAQVPVVWAELGGDAPGCDRCLRTWTSQESRFGVRGEVVPGYHDLELAAPPDGSTGSRTICDRPPGAAPGTCPWGEAISCGTGVAIERWDDGFRLTTQLTAGWFRYSQRWTFHRDGTIEPRFGFARGQAVCTGSETVETAVWRLDFDIGGPGNRFAPAAEGGGWEVTGRRGDTGYRLLAGDGDEAPRWLVSAYDDGELTDRGTSCAFDWSSLQPLDPPPPPEPAVAAAEGELPEAPPLPDPVIWYSASARAATETGCRLVGPTLVPFGPWRPPPGAEIFADGFESGGLGGWVTSDAVGDSPD